MAGVVGVVGVVVMLEVALHPTIVRLSAINKTVPQKVSQKKVSQNEEMPRIAWNIARIY